MIYKAYYLNNRRVDFINIRHHHKLVCKKVLTIDKRLDKPNKVNEYYYE